MALSRRYASPRIAALNTSDHINITRGTKGQADLQHEKRQANLPLRRILGIATTMVYTISYSLPGAYGLGTRSTRRSSVKTFCHHKDGQYPHALPVCVVLQHSSSVHCAKDYCGLARGARLSLRFSLP